MSDQKPPPVPTKKAAWELKERDLSGVDGSDKSLWLWSEFSGWTAEFKCPKNVAGGIVMVLNMGHEAVSNAIDRVRKTKEDEKQNE